jgi:pyrimidine-nucleoside phosphorylase
MKSPDDARRLAQSLVATGKRMGVKTAALLTDMNQPLGRMAGNLVEVHEALETLAGRGPADLWEVTRELGVEILLLTYRAATREAARAKLEDEITSGRALAKFREMVAAQAGDLDRLPPLPASSDVLSESEGFVAEINTELLGVIIIELGGGRKQMGDTVNHAAGLEMLVRLGDRITPGQPLVRVFAAPEQVDQVRGLVAAAITLAPEPLPPPALIAERVE